ncbi:MAG: 16S rRNA (cytosine(1402)-N(4))-methyltransferase RsmH [Bacteroidales bacterium]|nr:16S rRNA (cytosine(1402)-N(4))-methyltransferase RsmH [Bacteroidales bacterium]
MSEYHVPVLLLQSVDALDVRPDGVYADATLGGGGHTREILSRLGPSGRLIVFDRDADAIANAPADPRVITVHHNFRHIHHFVHYCGFPEGIDGILADLGVSSHQFDTGERGFSFRFDAPLDMRMDASGNARNARDYLASASEESLEKIFRDYGELEQPRRAASLIVRYRNAKPIETTTDLNEAVGSILKPAFEHKTLAKIYQALRIEVNSEMASLEDFLKGAAASLKEGGRLSVITYHSLEDRLVKNFVRSGGVFKAVNKKPILPDEAEIGQNTRARSAKLRVAQKTGLDG